MTIQHLNINSQTHLVDIRLGDMGAKGDIPATLLTLQEMDNIISTLEPATTSNAPQPEEKESPAPQGAPMKSVEYSSYTQPMTPMIQSSKRPKLAKGKNNGYSKRGEHRYLA